MGRKTAFALSSQILALAFAMMAKSLAPSLAPVVMARPPLWTKCSRRSPKENGSSQMSPIRRRNHYGSAMPPPNDLEKVIVNAWDVAQLKSLMQGLMKRLTKNTQSHQRPPKSMFATGQNDLKRQNPAPIFEEFWDNAMASIPCWTLYNIPSIKCYNKYSHR